MSTSPRCDRSRTIIPAHVPKTGCANSRTASSSPYRRMSRMNVVDSPPGMTRPSSPSSCPGFRTSTTSTPRRRSTAACSRTFPCRARTPILMKSILVSPGCPPAAASAARRLASTSNPRYRAAGSTTQEGRCSVHRLLFGLTTVLVAVAATATLGSAAQPPSDSSRGTGTVFLPNPVAELQDQTLTDQKDADYPALQPAYHDVTLTNLDGSGNLVGDWANVVS